MLRNLITGGAGFIGSHLAEHLLEAGEEVILWDDLSSGSLDNLTRCLGHPRCEVATGDITSDPRFEEHVARVDCLYHLAAVVGVLRVLRDPVAVMRGNLRATLTACSTASRHGVRLLLTSSAEVYGKSDEAPLAEDDDTQVGPTMVRRWSAATAKAMDEHLTLAHVETQGLRAVVVRLFNTAGPRQSSAGGNVLPRFIAQARSGGPISVYGDGLQRRTFAHVKDIVPALRRLMTCPGAEGEVVNLGSPEEVTILELARRVGASISPGAKIRLIPHSAALPAGYVDVPRRLPKLGRARSLIGFNPTRDLDDIITDILIADSASQPPPPR